MLSLSQYSIGGHNKIVCVSTLYTSLLHITSYIIIIVTSFVLY